LLTGENAFSETAETLRAIKVAIDLDHGGAGGRVIGIVSAIPGEGKTTVAASLAALISQTGRRVLVVDGDLRNPSLTRNFAKESKTTLIDVLADRMAVQQAIVTHTEHGFDVLPGAIRVRLAHTADILSSQPMTQLLDACRQTYDYILVDLPPLLPLVDVQAAAHLLDAFVMVTEWGRTTVDELDRALSVSPAFADRLLGVVLNKVDTVAMRRFEGYITRSAYPYYGASGARTYVSSF
jgi:capsular exopolysaccharide synthesis family protein